MHFPADVERLRQYALPHTGVKNFRVHMSDFVARFGYCCNDFPHVHPKMRVAGAFDPLDERGLLEELLLFVENLECDCSFITHHTIGGANLSGPDFLGRKSEIIAALRDEIERGDLEGMARLRAMKSTL